MCTLDPPAGETQERLLGLVLQPPAIQSGPPVRFAPVTLAMEDIRPMAEFIVMAIEAGRADMVKDIQFDLKLSTPALWILP